MSISQIASLGPSAVPIPQVTPTGAEAPLAAPRALAPGCAEQFRALCLGPAESQAAAPAATAAASSSATTGGTAASTATAADNMAKLAGQPLSALDFDIERVVLSTLPSADSSPAEFALGMLRSQLKVAQAAVGIELAAKTTQSLTQGVQTLTARG
ncbi:hypothetical protein [Aquabacterium sp. OR-4]|uniref:hypothetical protein n=1 Tax=Aquabacterium sp. OR-4 TaxID=2978127 RepID=UPI0021B2F707|nr:hypothetical protein [Aquabacterium sp. OR-4]MDT7836046.1 hypothetical protein [Aquabacterium sp. OR-4]